MKWDIFSGRKREKRGAARDEIDDLAKQIEKFAPKKYISERRTFYYNYKLLAPYLKPLHALLTLIAQKERLTRDQEDFICEVFLRVKDFYDPKQRLSLAEAIEDKSLRRRFVQLFLIYYGKQDLNGDTVQACFEKIKALG